MIEITEIEFQLLRRYLLESCGIDVPPEKRYLFTTRLGGLLKDTGLTNFSGLYRHLKDCDDPELRRRLVEAMTTHETSFFRDGHPFKALMEEIFPTLAKVRRDESRYLPLRLRVLCVGCATGEEPYTVAICAREWLKTQEFFKAGDVAVHGVDVSRPVLDQAQRGVYSTARLQSVPIEYCSQYFEKKGRDWRVSPTIRTLVTFSELNLAEPFGHLGPFDLILCRNVIIYLSATLKRAVVDQFFDMLKPEGVLLLGATETLYQISERFVARSLGSTTWHVKGSQK